MSDVRVVPIGNVVVPDDLVAPFECCGLIWLAAIGDVAHAAAGAVPLVSPCCAGRFGIRNLGRVAFFSKADWESAGDGDEVDPYYVGHAFKIPGRAA